MPDTVAITDCRLEDDECYNKGKAVLNVILYGVTWGVMAHLATTNLYVEVTQLRIFPIPCERHGAHPQTVVSGRQFLQLVGAAIVEELTASDALHHGAVLQEKNTHTKLQTEMGQDILGSSCLRLQLQAPHGT